MAESACDSLADSATRIVDYAHRKQKRFAWVITGKTGPAEELQSKTVFD